MMAADLRPMRPTRADLDAWWDRMRLETERPRPMVYSRLPLPDILGYARAMLGEDWRGVRMDLHLQSKGYPTRERQAQERAHALHTERLEQAALAMGML